MSTEDRASQKRGHGTKGSGLTRRSFVGAMGAAGVAGAIGSRSALAAGSGRISVYSTTLPPVQRRLAEAFTAKTGIAVQSLRLVNNPLAQRFLAEQQAKQYVCDVITLGIDTFYDEISKAGYLATIDDVPGVSKLSSEWRPGKQYVNILVAPLSIGYNTNSVKDLATLKEWKDLLRPEFKGQIIMADPRSNDSILAFLNMLHVQYGDDFMRALGAQSPKLVPAVPQGVEQVIAGEARIILPCLAMNLLQYRETKAPIEIISAPAPTQGTYFFTGISANALNMEGARQWLSFILSQEGQEILCKDNGVSPLGKIPGSLDPVASLDKIDIPSALKKAGRLYDLLGLSA
jgi:iron(III) transport system substrate-binding protein